MVDKKTAMILTLVGGTFYIVGGLVAGLFAEGLTAFTGGLTGNSNAMNDASGAFATIFAVGLITGIFIIISSLLINSNTSAYRKIGGVLAIIMALIGIIDTVGGLLIGFVMVLAGSIFGLTYHEIKPSQMTVPLSVPPSTKQYCCKICGAGVSPNQRYCPQCGRQLEWTPIQYCCRNCGAGVSSNQTYCPQCGRQLEWHKV